MIQPIPPGQPGVAGAQAEVQQYHRPRAQDHHVLGLQIEVENTLVVHRGERLADAEDRARAPRSGRSHPGRDALRRRPAVPTAGDIVHGASDPRDTPWRARGSRPTRRGRSDVRCRGGSGAGAPGSPGGGVPAFPVRKGGTSEPPGLRSRCHRRDRRCPALPVRARAAPGIAVGFSRESRSSNPPIRTLSYPAQKTHAIVSTSIHAKIYVKPSTESLVLREGFSRFPAMAGILILVIFWHGD